jgi:hypothetical protein
VLLDLRSGRYMGLIGKDLQSLEAEVAEGLAKSGLLTRVDVDSPHDQLYVPITPPHDEVTSAEVLMTAQLHVRQFAQLLLAYARARALLRWWSLEVIVSRVSRKTSRYRRLSVAHDAPKIRSLVRAYRRLSPLVFTARNACLLDSLVLIDFLFQSALPATWVVGVRTQPFVAHSWVQHDDVVLNDSVEKVRSFTPILAV